MLVVGPIRKEALPADRRHSIPNTDKVGGGTGLSANLGRVTRLERSYTGVPGRIRVGHTERVEAAHGRLRQLAQSRRIEIEVLATRLLGWDSADFEHMRDTARRISPAAEAQQVDAVIWSPDADNRDVAVDDLLGQAKAEHLAHIVGCAIHHGVMERLGRADTGDVESHLFGGIDDRVRPGTGRAIELIDVGAALVR